MRFAKSGLLAATALMAMTISASAATMIDKCEVLQIFGEPKMERTRGFLKRIIDAGRL